MNSGLVQIQPISRNGKRKAVLIPLNSGLVQIRFEPACILGAGGLNPFEFRAGSNTLPEPGEGPDPQVLIPLNSGLVQILTENKAMRDRIKS